MIQDIGPKQYDITYEASKAEKDSIVIPFLGEKLLMKKATNENAGPDFLRFEELVALKELMASEAELLEDSRFAFRIDEDKFYLVSLAKETALEALVEANDLVWVEQPDFRTLPELWKCFAGATAVQIVRWYSNRRFCGKCGQPFQHSETERAMVCKNCGLVEYPKISPVVIVGVTQGEKLLLTKYANRPYSRYALIAGFGEVGESLEDTVRREVFEEVGLKVKNITYYKSQPWSFSDSLLAGFFAELDGSDHVVLQESELAEGKWFERNEIPVPEVGIALTAEMIQYFADGNDPFYKK